jgi:SAM-dependent methyltransferase
MADVAQYYDQRYRILLDSEEEDQVYEIRNGVIVYRTAHQIELLLSRLRPVAGARILDYGCAKGAVCRALQQRRTDLVPYLFDVSEGYLPFWKNFAQPHQWAIYQPPEQWQGRFDVITSFFCLEHVVDLGSTLQRMHALLRPDGRLYFVVPNVLGNSADFVVLDHVNHFTATSIAHLLASHGFVLESLDGEVHRGAWTGIARRGADPTTARPRMQSEELPELAERVAQVARYWSSLDTAIRSHARQIPPDQGIAVYGSGFYGTYLAAVLAEPERLRCFVDRSPFRQGKQLLGKEIVAPEQLPADVHHVYVALNPDTARSSVGELVSWRSRALNYFFLDQVAA